MVWFVIFILLLVIYWFFHTDHSLDTDFFIGKKGCGKTATLSAMALEYTKKGMKVYTNVPLISNTYYFNPKQLDTHKPEPHSVALLDEVSTVWGNRDFRDFKAELFFRYCRQYQVKVVMFSQSWDVDLKIKSLVDRCFLMTKIGKVVLYRPVVKKLGVVKRQDGTGDLQDTFSYGSIFGWKLRYLPRYYGLFITNNPPQRPTVDSVLTKCTDLYTHYRTGIEWATYSLNKMKEKLVENVGRFSEKNLPILFRMKSNIQNRLSSVSATVTAHKPLVDVSLADYLFWLS